jgi:hypothetical protein
MFKDLFPDENDFNHLNHIGLNEDKLYIPPENIKKQFCQMWAFHTDGFNKLLLQRFVFTS